jgi:hypothetical protein
MQGLPRDSAPDALMPFEIDERLREARLPSR